MADVIFSFDLRPQPKRIIVQDNLDYSALGWDIDDVVAVVTFTGPQAIVYENTDFNSPDIVPATSLFLNKVIPLPLDPETNYENAIKGNYTLKVSWYNSVLDETEEFLDTYQYIFDIPTIANNTVSGPYSGTLTSTDTTVYGDNVFLLNREHRIKYPTQLPGPPPDIVGTDAVIVVTPIYTNQWTIQITSEVEYHNPDELIILWDGYGEFFECVYGSCISAMYDAINTMLSGYSDDLACMTTNQEAYQKRLVIVDTAWHLLNIAYQAGDVEEADAQSYVIQEQVEWTGSGTCEGTTSILVIPCPPYAGGETPPGDVDAYVFENGISKTVESLIPKIRLGGTPLIQNTVLTIGEYQFGQTGAYNGRTVSQTVDTVNGVLNKASDGSTEGRVYVAAEKVTLELADIATPANTIGYEVTAEGIIEKADYTGVYQARTLVTKSYVDANNDWGDQVAVTDATLTGDGTSGDPLIVANPFPGFDTLENDYGYTKPVYDFSEIENTPTTLLGYGIIDAYTQTELGTSGQSSVHYDNLTNVPTVTGYVPDTGGTFTGQVTFATSTDSPIVLKQVGSGGIPGIPEAGANYVEFQDGDGDVQGKVGIDATGNLYLTSNVSGGVVYVDDDLEIVGSLVVDALTFSDGETIDWNVDDYTLNIPTGLGPVLQVGQELYIIVYNGTGFDIPDGRAVYPIGASGGRPSVALANAETHVKIAGEVLITTMIIPDGEFGITTQFGKIRGTDTSGFNLGDTLWVSADSDGLLTNVKPEFPDYAIQVGGVTIEAEDGEILVTVRGKASDTTVNFWNGVFRETFDFLVTSTTTVVTGSLSPANGHEDMTMLFSDGLTLLDTDPAATITLTPGTDSNPQTNYIYIPKSTKVLTVSTSDWPTTVEHIKVAQVFLRTATTTATEGALRNQNWNDHIEDTDTFQGHLSHMTERMRQMPAKWNSGTEATVTIDSGPSPDGVYVSVTSGTVYQMHRQTYPAQDMQTGDDIHIVNHFTTPYLTVSNLNGQTSDANGVSLANSSFSCVIWGVCNKTGEESHLMYNLPTGSYAKNLPDSAVNDASSHSVYDIPKSFEGVGFLIARATFTLDAGGNVWTLYDLEDLRGKIPNTTAGGGGGGTGVTTFLALTDTPSSYAGLGSYQVTVNSATTALEFTEQQIAGAGVTYGHINDQAQVIYGRKEFNNYTGVGITPLYSMHVQEERANWLSYFVNTSATGFGMYIQGGGTTQDILRLRNSVGTDRFSFLGNGNFIIHTTPTTDGGSNDLLTYNPTSGAIEKTARTGLANDYVDSVGFNTTSGVLTLGRTGALSDLTEGLDGRYLITATEADLSFTDITTANATSLLHGLLPKLSGVATEYLNGNGAWATISVGLDPFAALTTNSSVSWDASGGLNKTWSINGNYTITLTNVSNGMSGDVKVTVTSGPANITLASIGFTFLGNGKKTTLDAAVYHLTWVATSSSTIEWNISPYV